MAPETVVGAAGGRGAQVGPRAGPVEAALQLPDRPRAHAHPPRRGEGDAARAGARALSRELPGGPEHPRPGRAGRRRGAPWLHRGRGDATDQRRRRARGDARGGRWRQRPPASTASRCSCSASAWRSPAPSPKSCSGRQLSRLSLAFSDVRSGPCSTGPIRAGKLANNRVQPTFVGCSASSSVNRAAPIAAIVRAAVVAIALGVGALGCGGSGGKSPITVRWGRGQAEHLFGRERRRRRRRNARRHLRLRRRLSQRLLRRRRLLQHRLHRDVHGLQRPGLAGDLHVRSGGRRAARVDHAARVATRPPAASTAPATAAAAAATTSPGRSARPGACDGRRGRRRQRLRRAGTLQGGAGDDLRARSTAIRRRTPASATCRSNADCVRGVTCVNGSCGPKPRGAVCTQGRRLRVRVLRRRRLLQRRLPRRRASAAARSGRVGTCWPIDAGRRRSARRLPGPGRRLVRADRAPATASAAARCTPPRRSASPPSCSGRPAEHRRHLQRPRRLPRARACRSARPSSARDGACIAHCTSDADCVERPRLRRTAAAAPSRTASPAPRRGECAQQLLRRRRLLRRRLRAAPAAAARCRRRWARCTPVAAGAADPRGVCVDQGAATLRAPTATATAPAAAASTPTGTDVRAPSAATSGVYTPPLDLQRHRQLRRARRHRLRPVRLQRRALLRRVHDRRQLRRRATSARTARAASSRTAPSAPTSASARRATAPRASAAPRPAPARASRARCRRRWASAPTCPTGAARSRRDLPGQRRRQLRHQRQVPGGRLPEATRRGRPAGGHLPARHDHASRRGRTCDGAGTCVDAGARPPASRSAAAPRRCKATCTADADCAAPAVCSGGSCGLKSDRRASAAAAPSARAASAPRASAAAPRARARACRARWPAAPAPARRSRPAAPIRPASAATRARPAAAPTGFCDGSGRLPAVRGRHRSARPPTCPAGDATATLGAHLRRRGHLQAGHARQSCAPYACNGTSLPAPPAAMRQRLRQPASSATAARAAQKRLGQICAAAAECDSGNCVDGVCCSSASCGTCAVCNVAGSAGACQPVPAGAMEPHGGCTAAPPCGFNGTCDGGGACRPMAAGHQLRHGVVHRIDVDAGCGACDGAGSCKQTPVSCAPYICGASACKTTCATTRGLRSPATPARATRARTWRPTARTCTARGRLHQRPLHRGLLLRAGRLRELQLVRGRGQAGNVFADRRRAPCAAPRSATGRTA